MMCPVIPFLSIYLKIKVLWHLRFISGKEITVLHLCLLVQQATLQKKEINKWRRTPIIFLLRTFEFWIVKVRKIWEMMGIDCSLTKYCCLCFHSFTEITHSFKVKIRDIAHLETQKTHPTFHSWVRMERSFVTRVIALPITEPALSLCKW